MSQESKPAPDPNHLEHCKTECGDLHRDLGRSDPLRQIEDLWRLGHRLTEGRRNLYRGEASAKHRLHSTLDRQAHLPIRGSVVVESARVEELVFRSFQREAHHYLSAEELPKDDDPMEWLAVMRHYGAPTRLLDWSYSFWISLFFAAAGARNEPAAVWVIDDEWAQAVATDTLRKKSNGALAMHANDLHCQRMETFNHVYVQESEAHPFVQKQNSWRRNARLLAQQGCFLCPGDVGRCFQSNLAAMRHHPQTMGRCPIQRIDFSQDLIPEILERLDSFGINYATMYPDPEGIGRDLSLLPLLKRRHASELRLNGIGGRPPGRTGEK
jgi:hypothetical protein